MFTSTVFGLIIWIAITTGWTPIPTPPVVQIEDQLAIEWAGWIRGFYDNKKVYLMELDDESTLVHELIHHYQCVQGRLNTIEVGKRFTPAECKIHYNLEQEAYTIENIYRNERGLSLYSLFAIHLAYLDCLGLPE